MSQTYTTPRPVNSLSGVSLTVPASNGTKTVFNRRYGYDVVLVEPAAAIRLGLAPRLAAVYHKTATQYIDLLRGRGRDGNNVTTRGFTGQSLPLLTGSQYLYLGFVAKVNDLYIDMTGGSVNATASTLTMANSTPSGFAALTVTADGTASGGATFAQDGNITFTVPAGAAWTPETLARATADTLAPPTPPLFWLRLAVSASLDAVTSVDQIAGFVETDGAGTNEGDTAWLNPGVEYTIPLGDSVGGLQPIAQAATATTMKVSWQRS